MRSWAQNQKGFTIVELLIVVVVIAILAAISVVAYTNIQNRAYDSAVQNDVTGFAKKIRFYEAEGGSLPVAGSKRTPANSTTFPGVTFTPAKSAYDTSADNFFYCSGNKSGVFTFTIAGRSKSGTIYIYRPETGMTSGGVGSTYAQCMSGFDAGTEGYSYGYYVVTGQWWSWTN